MSRRDVADSKFLSLVLRHRPDLIGITLDDAGWTDVAQLLQAMDRFGKPMSAGRLAEIVESSDKRRFAFDADRVRIRANQGHSVAVDLRLSPADPPDVLYHGTALRFLESIMRTGLIRQRRHHVHLHADPATARTVGRRRGEAALLRVDAAAMREAGHVFFRSENDVWLTDTVPARFLCRIE